MKKPQQGVFGQSQKPHGTICRCLIPFPAGHSANHVGFAFNLH
jgi:hypothetical protein